MTIRTIYQRRIMLLPRAWNVAYQGAGNKCQVYTFGNKWNILRARRLEKFPGATLPGEACMDAAYFDAKRFNGGPGGDLGATFWQLQRSLSIYGFPSIPWSDGGDLSSSNPPPADVYASAAANKPVIFEVAPYIRGGPSRDNLHETMAMLLQDGKPVPLTMLASRNFWNLGTSGNAEDVQYVYDSSDFIGEHAVLLVGRDLDKGLYYILNSWGPGFGAGGLFCVTLAEFLRCFTLHWHISMCPIPPVKEFDVATNPIPASVNAAMLAAFFIKNGVKDQLVAAYSTSPLGDFQALLNKAAELKLPARVVEIIAGWPENIIEDFVNRNAVTYPAELFYVQP